MVANEPIPGLEDIPLITQDFPGLATNYLPWGPFYGIWVKRDTPADVRDKLVEAFKKGASEPKFQAFINDFGAVNMNISGAEADEFLKKWQSTSTWILQESGNTKVSPADLGIPKP